MKTYVAVLLFVVLSTCAQAQVVAIQIDADSSVFVDVDNPLTIVVDGYKSSTLSVATNNGSITGSNGKYVLRPTQPDNDVLLSISRRTKDGSKIVKQTRLKARCPSGPDAYFFARSGVSTIPLIDVKVAVGFSLYLNHCSNFVYSGFVSAYKLSVIRNGKLVFDEQFSGEKCDSFRTKQSIVHIFNNLQVEDKLIFSDINYSSYGACHGKTTDIELTIR